jgi:Tol biopolymer transport system component
VSARAGNDNIYVMNAVDSNNDGNGDNLKRLTRNPENDLSPAWSPNGKKIAFTSFRTDNYEIYTMNADGSAQTRRTITGAPAHENNLDWQPGP